jgi:hypothetical protein
MLDVTWGIKPLTFVKSTFRVNIIYIDKDGNRHPVKGKVGDNALYLAHRYEIEMEGK